jgi:RNA polymerase sigma-70 factor, ECF subfamily
MARNHVRRYLVQAPMASGPATCEPHIDLTESELGEDQQLAALRAAILKLPSKYREVVVLCDLENFDYVRAAAHLGCAIGTVRSRLHRARALLRAKLHGRVRCSV